MPDIDVASEVVLDGTIAGDSFTVIRRRSWTDSDGFEQSDDVRIPRVLGSVYPTGNNSLGREDSFQAPTKTVTVVTKFLLRQSAKDIDGVNWQPDLIEWQGDRFIVTDVNDFSRYGPGFVEAVCTTFDYNNNPTLNTGPHRGNLDFRQRRNSGMTGVI